jgi:Bacterial protein of unknown function (HtrL_YibB)
VVHYTLVKPFDPLRHKNVAYRGESRKALDAWWTACDACGVDATGVTAGTTIVTALFDINRTRVDGRQFESYLEWFGKTLRLNTPMVIYTTPNLEPLVRRLRGHRPTLVVATALSDLPYAAHVPDIERILSSPLPAGTKDPGRVELELPLYTVLQFSKFEWLAQTSRQNPFHSRYFFWMDAGASRFFGWANTRAPWPCAARTFPDTALVVQARADVFTYESESLELDSVNLLVGTLFGGGAAGVESVAAGVSEIYKRLLAKGVVNNEQIVLAMLWKQRPNLFELVVNTGRTHLPLFKRLACSRF